MSSSCYLRGPRCIPERPEALSPPARRRCSSERRRCTARGFTIPELLAVVVMIGILAAAASPTFIQLMRDRRVNRAAMEISGLYRLARFRALGRGNAVLVRWQAPLGRFDVVESKIDIIDPADSQRKPILQKSCRNIQDWTLDSRRVTDFTVGLPPYELAQVAFVDASGGAHPFAELCFTARGRTFVRYGVADNFMELQGPPRITVVNTRTNLLRTVYIPPNGVARMTL